MRDRISCCLGTLMTLFLFLMSSFPASAQNPYHETILGQVAASESYIYTFRAAAGDVVTITVRTLDAAFDPRMTLYHSDGRVIDGNDDSDIPDPALNPHDARLERVALPETGDYVIGISGVNDIEGVGGRFEMTINWLVDQLRTERLITNRQNSTENALTSETGTYEVRPEDFAYTHFDGQRGDVYTITARAASGDLDVRLSLYLEDTLFITANDDHGSSDPLLARTDARIYNIVLPETGRYLLEVRGYNSTSGIAEMTIAHIASGAPIAPGIDRVYEGTLNGGVQLFSIEAEANDFVTLTVRAEDALLDPAIALIAPDGTLIMDNDNHGSNDADLDFFDARIYNALVLEDGLYVVAVTSTQNAVGPFTLTISTRRHWFGR